SMDVSDGLVQDLGHLCRASSLAAEIDTARVPLSDAARHAGPEWLPTCLTGGDDYELLLAVPPARDTTLLAACAAAGVAVTRIGRFRAGSPGVIVRGPDGAPLALGAGGWSHF
ncbi:MAG: AIR synthase-related protein, partial [Acetobacteraceae bacterium]